MLVERGVVRVGMEIEVVSYRPNHSNQTVAKELMDAGYMIDDGLGWRDVHRYGCRCQEICRVVRSGNVIVPPMTSLTYDASLPDDGGEWVVSAIVLADEGLAAYREIFEIIGNAAMWDNTRLDRRGDRHASPSIHLHVSATNDREAGEDAFGGADNPVFRHTTQAREQDIYHALSLFGPEFLLLASTTDVRRGVHYRQPLRLPDQGGHHGFAHVRRAYPGLVHIEWRLFEAAYQDFEYIEAGAFLAAGLTRALLDHRGIFPELMQFGYAHYLDDITLAEAVGNDDLTAVLKLVDPNRLAYLRETVIGTIDDDPRGQQLVSALFEKGEALL